MRTLKKALCLVLALVMCVGMFAIGGNAFTDDATVQYKTAVTVMTGIGAIDGYDDGSFKPTGAVKRSEAAKMITYAVLGPTVASKLSASASAFDDVKPTEWYAPYVAYCASRGIITGVSDKAFNPDGAVTSYQLGKMILVAAGYGAKDEYEGDGWDLAVATDGFKLGVYTGTKETDFTDAATREETALYIFNGLFIPQVSYNDMFGYYPKGDSFTGSLTTNTNTIAKEIYGIKKDAAAAAVTVVAKNTNSASANYGKLEATAGGHKFVVDSYDMVGHKVVCYYKDVTGAADNGKVYGYDQTTTAVKVYGMTNAQWKSTFKKDTYTVDADYAFAAGVAKYTNFTANSTSAKLSAPTSPAVFTDADTLIFEFDKSTQKNVLVAVQDSVYYFEKVVVSKALDGTYSAVVTGTEYDSTTTGLTTALTAKTVYNGKLNAEGKVTTNRLGADVDFSKYYNVDTAKSFGYFIAQAIDNQIFLTAPATATGVITAVGASSASVTVGGTTYYVTAVASGNDKTGVTDDLTFEGDHTVYLDSYGRFFAVTKDAAATVQSDVYYVIDVFTKNEANTYGSVANTYAQVVDMKGELSSILIGVAADGSYDNATGVNTLNKAFYTFATDTSSGSKSATLGFKEGTAVGAVSAINNATVFAGCDKIKAGDVVLTTKSVAFAAGDLKTATTTKVYITAATNFIFIEGTLNTAKVTTVAGGINDTLPEDSLVLVSKTADGAYVATAVIKLSAYTNAGVAASDLLYFTGDAYTGTAPYTANDTVNTGYTYTAYKVATGEKVTVLSTNSTVDKGFWTYKVANDVYTTVSEISTAKGAFEGAVYASKIGTVITTTTAVLTDVEAGSAVIVDLRTEAEKTTSGVSTIGSISDIAYFKAAGKTITMDIYAPTTNNVQSVATIFVTGPTT